MRYLSRFYSKHKVIYTVLILLLVVSCTLLGSVLDIGDDAHAIAVEEEKKISSKACQMFMTENMTDVVFYSYMEDGAEGFNRLQEFRNELDAEDDYTYVIQSNQALEVRRPEIQDIFLEGYEDGYADSSVFEIEGETIYTAKALQVSKEFFEIYSIQVETGKIFASEDYRYNEKGLVPVILGAAYKGKFELGDIIEADYLFTKMQFQVIGFLENDAFYYSWNSDELTSCERYIIMPAFQNLPADEFGKRALLQYFTAYIVSDESYDQTQEKIQSMMKKNGVSKENLSMVDLNGEEQQINIMQTYSAMTSAVSGYFKIMIGIMIACIGFVLTIVLTNMIQEENYNFGVYIMCGMKRSRLAALIFMMDGIIVGGGDCVVICLLVINRVSVNSILMVQAVVAFVLFISFGVCYLRLKKINITDLIGGKE